MSDIERYSDNLLYYSKEPKVIQNTIEETSFFTDNKGGSLLLPPNFFDVGVSIIIKFRGFVSNSGTPTNTIKIKLDGTEINSSSGSLPLNMDKQYFDTEIELLCSKQGVDGLICACGRSIIQGGVGITTASIRGIVDDTPSVIDTTKEQLIDVTYTWEALNANNILTIIRSSIIKRYKTF